jgi:glycerol kinase
LRDELKLIHDSSDSEYFARKVSDSAGVYLVPAFSGRGAPIWDMHARGTILGLTAGSGKNHVIRAALESIAYQTEDVIAAMNADIATMDGANAEAISVLKVDGGASANGLLMQMQSDFSGITVQRSANPEATAAGAAFLAGLAVGFYADRNEIKKLSIGGERFVSHMPEGDRKAALDGWHRALRACRVFSESEE